MRRSERGPRGRKGSEQGAENAGEMRPFGGAACSRWNPPDATTRLARSSRARPDLPRLFHMRIAFLTASLLVPCLGAACVWVHATDDSTHDHAEEGGVRASAKIEARSGSTVSGTARFRETKGGVLVEIEVHHAPPGRPGAASHGK